MGFVTHCIVMFLCGLIGAYLYSHKLRKKNHAWSGYLAMICIFTVLLWGILIYTEVIPIAAMVNWLPWVDVTNGKDWMWNSFQLIGVDLGVIFEPGMNSLAVILFISYPTFYAFGADGGRMLFGRKTYEEGYMWGLAPLKKPKNIK
jgi:hypothetical protein